MAGECCCGNVLERDLPYRSVKSPCLCEAVGPRGRSGRRNEPQLGWVTEEQRQERRRLGLPEVTDIEKGASMRWV